MLGLLTLSGLGARLGALFVFLGAIITDFLDGRIARKRGMVTNFGILMDPLADKILVCSAFISFVGIPELKVPAWMVVAVVAREFLVTGVRLLGASRGKILPAARAGKHKAASQMVAIVLILLVLVARSLLLSGEGTIGGRGLGFGAERLDMILGWIVPGIMTIVLLFTLVSGYKYLRENRDLLTSRARA